MNTHDMLQEIDRLSITDKHAEALHQAIFDEMTAIKTADFAGARLTLSGYLEAVKMVVAETFDHEVWVSAEIRAVNSKGGHYYFELAEKDDKGNIIASTRATLWRYRAGVVDKFAKSAGRPLGAGLAVLLKGSASFHPQYGFSINISDIDPTYTLGALAQAYHAMLKRLHDEGLTTLNKSLPLPFDIRHVIVIAPQNGAGLGDFRAEADRLAQAGACDFYYHHATFQGNHAPNELRSAISHAVSEFYARHEHHADLLVIIRGGGAVGDLAYLNDYELSALVAELPMPAWVGIGHERDKVLLDEVAHTRFDTPSKVIHAIEVHLMNMVSLAKTAMKSIHDTSMRRLTLAKKDSEFALNQLKTHAKHHLDHQKRHTLDLLIQQQNTAYRIIDTTRQEVRHLQSLILLQHPTRTLAKGYTLVRQEGKIVRSQNDLQQGEIDIEFYDGQVKAVVK